MSQEAPPIDVFVSYASRDETFLKFIPVFAGDLTEMVRAKLGRELQCFIDRSSIQWGEVSQDRIYEEIAKTAIFLPIATANYLESVHCRREFLAFEQRASSLNAIDLILPVLPVTTSIFSTESDDDVARRIARLQCEDIHEAVLEGPGTGAWRTMIDRLADRLIRSVESAEKSTRVGVDETPPEERRADGPADDDDDDEEGFSEQSVQIEANIGELTERAQALGPAIEALGNSFADFDPKSEWTPQQLQANLLRVARNIRQPSEHVRDLGLGLAELAADTGSRLYKVRDLAAQTGDIGLLSSIESSLADIQHEMAELDDVEKDMQELLDAMQIAEIASSAIRKSMRPARSGFTAIRDALRIIRRWGDDPKAVSEL